LSSAQSSAHPAAMPAAVIEHFIFQMTKETFKSGIVWQTALSIAFTRLALGKTPILQLTDIPSKQLMTGIDILSRMEWKTMCYP
jgi:hypothetical protein